MWESPVQRPSFNQKCPSAGFNSKLAALGETKLDFDQAVYESEMLCIKLAQARLEKSRVMVGVG